MFEFLKKLTGKKSPANPDIYKGVKDPREALLLMKESRKRDENRRREAMGKVDELVRQEDALMQDGRREGTSEQKRLHIARQVRNIRDEKRILEGKLASIYEPRIKAFNQYISAIETAVELQTEQIPTGLDLEQTAIKAKMLLEELEVSTQMAIGMGSIDMAGKETGDPEEQAILQEMEELRAKDDEKKDKERRAATKKAALDRMIDRGIVSRKEVDASRDIEKLVDKKIDELELAEEEES